MREGWAGGCPGTWEVEVAWGEVDWDMVKEREREKIEEEEDEEARE